MDMYASKEKAQLLKNEEQKIEKKEKEDSDTENNYPNNEPYIRLERR